MNRVGNPFRFSFIIRVVFGIRLETDDLLVSKADHGHAPGTYQSDVSKDIGGASLVESFDARNDMFDYYDNAEADESRTDIFDYYDNAEADESRTDIFDYYDLAEGLSYGTWVQVPFNVRKNFNLLSCSTSSLASLGSDVKSSSESLLHGLDDDDYEDQPSSMTISAHVGAQSTNSQVRVNLTSRRRFQVFASYSLESTGLATLNFSVNFTVSGTRTYERTWVQPLFHMAAYAAFISVGLKFTLAMTGTIILTALVPVTWDICVTNGGVSCDGRSNSVRAASATFSKTASVTITGTAEVCLSLSFEAAAVLSVAAQVKSSMTMTIGSTNSCRLLATYAVRLQALTSLTHLVNGAIGAFNWVTASCFGGFGDINLALLFNGTIFNRSCPGTAASPRRRRTPSGSCPSPCTSGRYSTTNPCLGCISSSSWCGWSTAHCNSAAHADCRNICH